MIDDLMLRWVVTALMTLSSAECLFAVVTQRRPWTSVVNHGLYIAMATAMVVMAWPWGARLPTAWPKVFFIVAAIWFVAIAVISARTVAERRVFGYHALMMVSMVWMYNLANHRVPSGGDYPTPLSTSMPVMDVCVTMAPASSAMPRSTVAINWLWFVGFAIAAVVWIFRATRRRLDDGPQSWNSSLAGISEALMAAGMAIMFGAMVFGA